MSNIEAFQGVGYQAKVNGVLVLRTKRMAYYGPGGRLPAFSINWKSIKYVSSSGEEVGVFTDKLYQFSFASKSDAKCAESNISDRILARKRKHKKTKEHATLEAVPSPLDAPEHPQALLLDPDSLFFTRVSVEPESLAQSKNTSTNGMPMLDDSYTSCTTSPEDLEEILAISNRISQDRHAKRKQQLQTQQPSQEQRKLLQGDAIENKVDDIENRAVKA